MARQAIICGGSIGGLFCAAFLVRAGWQVRVLERSRTELSGRGAGIVTHDLLVRLILTAGAATEGLGVQVEDRVAYDRDGGEIARLPLPQIVTSWDRVHSLLRALVPPGAYLPGKAVARYDESQGEVGLTCEDGSRFSADLLVGADGFRSSVRGQRQPEIQPVYSGYVVWRCLAPETALPPDVRTRVFDHFGFFLPEGTQVLGYPIAGPGNDLRPGHRRYNFVWYAPVKPDELADMLTDDTGFQHALTIPPPLIRAEVLERMRDFARRHLALPFQAILARSERPFFAPIYDHLSPAFAAGRVALAGDAAAVARPHVGMGVTKAAADAEALARHLAAPDLGTALAAYDAERRAAAALAVATGRRLGGWIMETPLPGANRDGRHHPQMARIMAETAVIPQPAAT